MGFFSSKKVSQSSFFQIFLCHQKFGYFLAHHGCSADFLTLGCIEIKHLKNAFFWNLEHAERDWLLIF